MYNDNIINMHTHIRCCEKYFKHFKTINKLSVIYFIILFLCSIMYCLKKKGTEEIKKDTNYIHLH